MGTRVVVRSYEESVIAEGVERANRGSQLPAKLVDPNTVYDAVAAEEARKAALE